MTPEELKKARKALGMSQSELGNFLGYNGRSVRRWEGGDPKWPVPVAVNLLLRWIVWDECPDVPGYDWPEVDDSKAFEEWLGTDEGGKARVQKPTEVPE